MSAVQDVELVLGLLAVMAALATLARRLDVPYPVLFVLGGFALGLVPGVPQVTLAPDLVLLLFLPPLLYSAGVFTPLTEVRANLSARNRGRPRI